MHDMMVPPNPNGDGVITMAEQKKKLVREKLIRELGPTIMNALSDPKVVEVMLNPDGVVWIDVLGEGMKDTGTRIPTVKAENLLGTIASMLDITIDAQHPVLQCELPLDGSRVQGLLPPIVAGATFAIRKRASVIFTLEQYVQNGIMSEEYAQALKQGIHERKNILVVGSTGSGKTTLCNALLHQISQIAGSDQRVVIIEDTVELQCSAPNCVQLRTSDEVDMTGCLKSTMRLRPDRIIVGEVRDHAALALLKAWNTGHPGGLCTVHANSSAAGLLRLEQLIAEAKNFAPQPILIAEAVDLVAFITRTATGRRVTELIRVLGYEGGRYILEPVVPSTTA